MDGLSDLCLAESVFQAVGGNYSRSGAVLEGMSGDGQIPDPEISLIPRSGPRQIQRVALAFEAEPLKNLRLRGIDDTIPWVNPRKLVEPNLDKIVKSSIGAISFWIDLKDISDNVTSTEELGLTDLGLDPIDLIYIENSELDARLNFYAKSKGFINYDIRYERNDSTPEQIERKSLTDLQFLINALRELVVQGRPLDFSDFQAPNEIDQKVLQLHSIKEIFQRYYDIILLLIQTLDELELALNDNTEFGIKKKRQALVKAGLFASEFAVPVTSNGNIMEMVVDLNEKIEKAVEELRSRLPQGNDQAEKLLDWKLRLETEGEAAFLESLVDGLSGDSTNSSNRYLKTIEILIEQVRIILKINSFLILPTVTVPSNTQLESSLQINEKVLKWIEKTSYVRPRVKLLDEIITYNQILESSDFSFYCDQMKFMKTAELFNAPLSGQKEVPQVNTQAMGMAEFTSNGENVDYLIKTTNIEGVTAGDIHSGVEGENGPVIVSLFKFDLPQNEISKSGIITTDMLKGPMEGKTIADLISSLKNGNIYVNIHTEQNPNGEIRGQILVNEKEEVNPVSLILVVPLRGDENDDSSHLNSLTGIVADDWTDKIISKEQDTHIAFHYNGPNTEAPQCLLLAVSPNDLHKWDESSIRKVILDTLELMKLRAVNYRWVKELRHFLPAMLLNSHGEDIFINLYKGDL